MKIAFMFSGQGAQYPGMGKDLYDKYPYVKNIFEEANRILGYDIADIMFNNEEKLNETGVYYIYCWDPYEKGGDYTIVIGKLEIWGPFDILRALFYTPLIRRDFELHIN